MAKMAKADNIEFSMQWPKADDGKRVHHLIKITIDFSSAFAHLHLFKHALLLHMSADLHVRRQRTYRGMLN